MGTLSNILTTLGPALTGPLGLPGLVVSTAAYATKRGQEAGELRARQKLARNQQLAQQQQMENELAQKNELERQRLVAEAESNEARRRNALRRAVARQKTLFSAQGLSSMDEGSSEAVLLGLYDDNSAEQAEDDHLNSLRSRALDQNMNTLKQRNLLESTQLAQEQQFYRALHGY